MVFPTPTERFLGVTFGTAIGDALGYPVEFSSSPSVKMQLAPGAHFSDDTQMYMATMQGLLDAGIDGTLDVAGYEVAKRYVEWSISPENNRAPGGACMYGCGQLAKGIQWRSAGKPAAGGCGTAMRSMAYGQRFWGRPERAIEWAGEHALMTHRHAMAQAAAAAVAGGVSMLAYDQGTPGNALTKDIIATRMINAAQSYDKETADMLQTAVLLAQSKDATTAGVLNDWRGWAGHEAVAASLFCFLRYDNFTDAVLGAVNSPGDSDSLGAITGALAGGFYGLNAIDLECVANIEKTEWLLQQASVFFQTFIATR